MPDRDDKQSRAGARGILAIVAAFLVLGFFSTLPLRWKDQAVLGFLLVTAAIVINRLFKSRLTTLFLTLTACFCTARYAYYRYSETFWHLSTSWSQIHPADAFFVLLLIAAETYSFVILFLGCFQTARPLLRKPLPLPENVNEWPTVDIFIPTYNEPLDVVSSTVLAALNIDWPSDKMRVYVLDDGRRASFREFAESCGATYITRLDNAHAKAGNINRALKQTNGEYIAIFDCDHVPTRSFLQMTMGWLVADKRLGLVQTPHHFYSADPFERNLGIFRKVPNESALFYGIIQDGNDLWDATFFCGSCAVLRRTALEEIGGIAVETVTEDSHTALRLHSRGWNTAYINLPQAAGLATSKLADHVGQRIRWARGMVQILRVDNPLFIDGLKLPQRLCYLNAMLHYLFAGPRLVFLTSPLVYLIFGRFNVFGYLPAILAYGLPHVCLATVVNSRIHGRHRHSFWNEVYEIVLAPYIFLPTMLALINPRWGKFNVTAKEGVVKGTYFDWNIAKPFAVLLAINVIGISIGVWKYHQHGDPQGVLTVNLIWAAFNSITLGAALAVAQEKRQVRASVRVAVKLPLELHLESGEVVSGLTDNLSMGGLEAKVLKSGILLPGDSVQLTLSLTDGEYPLPATVVQAAGSSLRLSFGELGLAQKEILTRVIFSRADSWIDWAKEYRPDRPFANLAKITWISFRGIGAALAALVPRRKPRSLPSAVREQAVLPLVALLFLLGSVGARVQAQQEQASIRDVSMAAAPTFHDFYNLTTMGQKDGVLLHGKGATFTANFGSPMTKMVLNAALSLRYRASSGLLPASQIRLSLNGSPIGAIQLTSGDPNRTNQAELAIPPELFLVENSLVFEFAGECAGNCEGDDAGGWVAMDPATSIQTSGTLLPLPDRLTLLPAPFLEQGAQRVADIPIVLPADPDTLTLQAAGVIASWFGTKAENRGIRFPVTLDRLPAGNVVLLTTAQSGLASSLSLPSGGNSVSVRDNPGDPYGKVLAIVAPTSKDLLDAAQAFSLQNFAAGGATASLPAADLPPVRKPFDAPRWSATNKDVRIAEGEPDGNLQIRGNGAVRLYFSLPPDLYFGSHDTVPFHLKYRCSTPAGNAKGSVKVHLNDTFIASRPIPSDASTELHEEILHLPVSSLFPHNTLIVEFAFAGSGGQGGAARIPSAAVLRTSELKLGGTPHFSEMPRLDMFANTGFPFTRMAGLSQTVVVLPPSPLPEELSLYLTFMGFTGSQTGYPGLRVQVWRGSTPPAEADKDILLIAGYGRQPLLQQWSPFMLLQPQAEGFVMAERFDFMRLTEYLPGGQLARERSALQMLLRNETDLDAVVQGFASPLEDHRSVIAITGGRPGRPLSALANDWSAATAATSMYGTLSLFGGGRFHSFTLNPDRYHVGSLATRPALDYWARRYYWISPLVILAFIWFVTVYWDRWLESVAKARLTRALSGGGQ